MSGIGIAFAVAGWVLFVVTLLAFVGRLAVGQGRTEREDAAAGREPMDRDVRPKGIDFDRDPEARRRFMEDAP
jgi:hypothetical protein